MITVIYQLDNNKIINVNISGHAAFAKYQKDIVCAGVSSIVIGTLNALTQLLSSKTQEVTIDQSQDANININVLKITVSNQIILQTMYWQLKTIAAEYPNNIKIEEVYQDVF